MSVFVTVTDEEGFNTHIVGPFTPKAANKFVAKHEATYGGHCQEPYQTFKVTSPKDFESGWE